MNLSKLVMHRRVGTRAMKRMHIRESEAEKVKKLHNSLKIAFISYYFDLPYVYIIHTISLCLFRVGEVMRKIRRRCKVIEERGDLGIGKVVAPHSPPQPAIL